MRILTTILVTLTAAGTALAGTLEAPLDVRQTAEAKLTSGPKASKANGKVKISFAIDKATDVEVAVVDGQGKVVRHLAAGLLGKNAPEPFRKDSLSQEIEWDLRDDAGKPVSAAGLKVRVRAGSKPGLDRVLGRVHNTLAGGVDAITVGANGELYVLMADGSRGRLELRVLDREGKYLRTVVPYSAKTPPERTESIGHVMVEGDPSTNPGKQRQPLVFNGQAHSLHPFTGGMRSQTMAWHPKGYLVAVGTIGAMCNHGPPRFLIAFHPEGGAPEGVSHVGPKIRKERGFLGGAGESYSRGMDRLAISPDGEWIYFNQNLERNKGFQTRERRHGIYRVKWTDEKLGELWLGKKEAGAGDDEFNDPEGMAVDAAGNLYVCDRNNDRVKVYSPEGKLLGKFAAPKPEQIAVHPKTGEIYVGCRSVKRYYEVWKSPEKVSSRLIKFGAFKDGAAKELARLEFPNKKRGFEQLALDASGPKPKLWVTFYLGWSRGGKLVPVVDEGGALKMGEEVGEPGGLHFPSFLAADPKRNRVIIYEHLAGRGYGHRHIDLKTGKVTPVNRGPRGLNDLAIDQDGNIYTMDHYGSNTMSRYDSNWKPLNFPATGNNKLSFNYRAYGVGMGLRGHVIAPNGDLYVRRSPNHARISTVDVYSPDGKPKKPGLVRGCGSGDSGIGVDNRGNVYLGMNLKPADKVIPEDFAGAVPAEAWKYYRSKDKRKPPWSRMYSNPYIFFMGSVMKFGPEGGKIYGNFSTRKSVEDPELVVAKAPPEGVAYKSSYTRWDIKVVGAKWRYPGVGIIPHSFDGFRGDDGCECMQSQLDADPYGRTYAPSAFRSSVEMLDSAGNRIARVGTYGNADDEGLHFAWPCETDFAEPDGRLYVTDSVNRSVVVVKFDWSDEKTCGL
ncbi:MAG: SMP-30/gluconolactonase/LRE family protein [Planctomycetota bacterium]|jgi:sugar lactone lactonase YvrE